MALDQSTPTNGTAVERAVARLKDSIRTGRFVPGQRLTEPYLTELLGLSRGAVRETLARLKAEGLIDIEPYRGASVHKMTRDQIDQVVRVRALLAGEAARLAAANIDVDDHAEQMRQELERQAVLRGDSDVQAYAEANVRFHGLIDSLSGNPVLAGLLDQLQTHAGLFFSLAVSTSKDSLLEHHFAIAEAILAGDQARAERLMRRHVTATLKPLAQLPDLWFE